MTRKPATATPTDISPLPYTHSCYRSCRRRRRRLLVLPHAHHHHHRHVRHSQPPPLYSFSRLAAVVVIVATLVSHVSASITCALPAGGSYKAGDSIILDWGSDGTSPVVTDITSINGTLYCNTNNVKVADVAIPNVTGPFNWTVPSVGNATTAGGTVGICAQNAFHIEYSGEANGFLGIVKIPWGPVRCGTITIVPAPNGTVTTTTTTMTSTTRTSSLVSPTATNSNSNGGGGLSTAAVAIIAVAATLFLTLSGVALVVCMRKRRHQRKLDKVLRTWNGPGVNQFSKVSTVAEDEPTSSGAEGGMTSIAGAGTGIGTVAGVTGMGIRHSYDLKPQPTLPQPSSYYAEDGDYGYAYAQQQQQQQQQRLLQQQQQQQGYDPYSDDDAYYNPYYASGAGLALGATTSTGMVNQSTPSFYSTNHANHSGSRLPSSYNQHAYQSVSDFHHHHPMSSGYIPPPPPLPSQGGGGSSSSSNARAPAFTGTGLAGSSSGGDGPTASALTSMTIDSSSAPGSPKRAPQTVMKQVSKKEAEEEEGGGGDGHGDGDSEGKEENNVDDTNLKVPV